MQPLLTSFLLLFSLSLFGQPKITISGKLVDQNNVPIDNVTIYYGRADSMQLSKTFSDKNGKFELSFIEPLQYTAYLYFEKKAFFSKSMYHETGTLNLLTDTPIILRNRKEFWYDSKKINKSHIGISVKEAINRYKLDINSCSLVQSPFGIYRGFTAELADSSTICFEVNKVVSDSNFNMTDFLDFKIIGIRITDVKGKERLFGYKSSDWECGNGYFIDRKMQEELEKLKN